MGDRANAVRWDDDAYLARIMFDQMTLGDHGEETGFGITTSPPDGAPTGSSSCTRNGCTASGCGVARL
jgi:hypothetical protein